MSINFHAYQCRDYLLSDYEEIEKQWRAAFSDYDPDRVMRILDLVRDDAYLYVRYFETLYRLRLSDGVLEKQIPQDGDRETVFRQDTDSLQGTDAQRDGISGQKAAGHVKKPSSMRPSSSYLNPNGQHGDRLYLQENPVLPEPDNGWSGQLYFNETMAVYHLLRYVKDDPSLSGRWIPNDQLDTRAGGNSRQKDMLLETFSRDFAGKTELLDAVCRKAGGTCVSTKADLSYQFYPFPQVPIQLLFWDEDEDFPAQTQIMVDQQVTDYVHPDTTGCMAADLMKLLKSLL